MIFYYTTNHKLAKNRRLFGLVESCAVHAGVTAEQRAVTPVQEVGR